MLPWNHARRFWPTAETRAFVQQVYYPDVLAIAAAYKEWFGIGAGVTNLKVGDLIVALDQGRIAETGTHEAYNRDPRAIAGHAEKYLASTGLADSAVFT